MIETPSSTLLIEEFCKYVDFFSIGTNDLTQYIMAADRGNPNLVKYQDPLHPSILRTLDKVISTANKNNIEVSVCGEMSSDSLSATALYILGLRVFSMSPSAAPFVFQQLNKIKEMDLVTPGFGLIFWTSVVFIILLFLLKKMAWTPILNNVDARNKSIEEALYSAETARKEMANLHADNQRILQEARSERDEMLKEARDIKASIVSDAKNTAKDEADKIIASAKAVIENEKAAAISELKNSVGALSIEIAEKVLKSELKDIEKQNTFISEMLKDVKLN